MSLTSAKDPLCRHCGYPIKDDNYTFFAGLPYHLQCTSVLIESHNELWDADYSQNPLQPELDRMTAKVKELEAKIATIKERLQAALNSIDMPKNPG